MNLVVAEGGELLLAGSADGSSGLGSELKGRQKAANKGVNKNVSSTVDAGRQRAQAAYLDGGGLPLVVGGALDLPLLLEGVDDVLVAPSDLVREPLDGAVLSPGLESEDSESVGDDHLLLSVVGRGHTLEELESLKGGSTSGGLVRNLVEE